MKQRLTRFPAVFLTVLLLQAPGEARAATGLSSLQGLAEILLFFIAVGIVAAVVVAIYIVKRLKPGRAGEIKSGKLFRIVTLVILLLGLPVFLTAFSVPGFQPGWLIAVILFLALLSVALLDLTDNKRIVFSAVGATLLVYVIIVSQIVSFTAHQIVDNQAFVPTHELAERMGATFIRTTDGGLYRLTRNQLPRRDLFHKPVSLRIEISPTSGDVPSYSISSVGESNEHYRYRKDFTNPWFTIPLQRITIAKNSVMSIGYFKRLDGTQWTADNRELNAAIYESCCDASWFATLIEHGADPTQISIGSRNLLHFLANRINRHDGIVEAAAVFVQAGVELNQKDQWGKTPLFVAVDSAEHSYFQRPELAARFTGFIKLLLESGADPNITADYGFTPLHEAVISRRYELASLLLNHGANPALLTTDNRSAFQRASNTLKHATDDAQKQSLQALISEMEQSVN